METPRPQAAAAAATGDSPSAPLAAPRRHPCPSRSSMRIQAQPKEPVLHACIGGELGHRAGVDHAAVVHHAHGIADLLRDTEILFHQQDRGAAPLHFLQALDQRADDRRRKALGRLVDQQQAARLNEGAREREHLLLPARQRAGAREPELLERREETENPVEARFVHRAFARRQHEVFAHREIGKHRHGLRHVADAGARDIGDAERLDALATEPYFPRRGVPQAHDGAQCGRLARAVAAEQHRGAAIRHVEVDAVQNVVLPDVGLDPGQREKRAHAAFPPTSPGRTNRDRPPAPPARRSPPRAFHPRPACRCAAR